MHPPHTSPCIPSGGVKRRTDFFETLFTRRRPSTTIGDDFPAIADADSPTPSSSEPATKQRRLHGSIAQDAPDETHMVSLSTDDSMREDVVEIDEQHDRISLLSERSSTIESPSTSPSSLNARIIRDDSFIRHRPAFVHRRRRMSDGSTADDGESECRSEVSRSASLFIHALLQSIGSDVGSVSLPPSRALVRRETSKLYNARQITLVKRTADQLFESLAIVCLVPIAEATELELSACRVTTENIDDIKYIPSCQLVLPRQNGDASSTSTLAALAMPSFARASTSIVVGDDDRNETVAFSLVLTDAHGRRSVGHCLRFVPRRTMQAVVVCLVADRWRPQLYGALVDEFRAFMDTNGWRCAQFAEFVVDTMAMKPPLDHQPGAFFPPRERESNIVELCERMGVDVLLAVVEALLNDSRVVISAPSIAMCTTTIQTLLSLIYPFTYPHSLILVLPRTFVELCHAPTPYLFGILRAHLDGVRDMLTTDAQQGMREIEEPVLIVDVDYGILRGGGSERRGMDGGRGRLVKAIRRQIQMETDARVLPRRIHELIAVDHMMLIAHSDIVNVSNNVVNSNNALVNDAASIAVHPWRSWRARFARLVATSLWHVWVDDETRSELVETYCARVRQRAFHARLGVNLAKLAAFVFAP